MAKCSKCGKLVLDNIKFCPECGYKIKTLVSKKANEVGFFYRINYSLVSLLAWLISVIAFILIQFKPDKEIRFFDSFMPYFILFLIIVFITSIVHLILRRKDEYSYKGKVLAIILIILTVLTFMVPIFTGKVTTLSSFGCHTEMKYYPGCNKEPNVKCVHYSMFGFGDCDACEKTICPNIER